MIREGHVWRVVIDHKPEKPKDWSAWMANCSTWFMFRDEETDHGGYDPHVPGPEDLTDENALKAWSWWTAGQRMRSLSQRTAKAKVELLTEYGIDAHLERGSIEWEPWPRGVQVHPNQEDA